MNYNVVFAPEAEEDYHKIGDPILQSRLLDEIDKLAADPQGLSRPGGFPYYFARMYPFWCVSSERRMHITILFDFTTPDTITILASGMIRT